MGNDASYALTDEPRPGALAQYATRPLWPMLAVMLGGVWLSWSWFIFNSFAFGSPTRKREIAWVIGGLVGSLALVLGIVHLTSIEVLGKATVKYAMLVVVLWKLAVTYVIYSLQERSFNIFEYYGGIARNGLGVLLAAYFLNRLIINGSELHPLVTMLLFI